MDITIGKLESMGACRSAVEWLGKQNETNITKLYSLLKESGDLTWGSWVLNRSFSKEQNVKYAIFSAELVLGIYENKYPRDDRPRNAIKAAKDYLKNPSSYADAAYVAANAAAAAAYAAYVAANAADAAAAYAAYAASAAANAVAAAYAAADAGARRKMQIKILDFGLNLLLEK